MAHAAAMCGSCSGLEEAASHTREKMQRPRLPDAWQGAHVAVPGAGRWASSATNITTSHPSLFARAPEVDANGSLTFVLHEASAVWLPCYSVCVTLRMATGRGRTTSATLRVLRDPCGAASSCRSLYFRSQFDCHVGREWESIFRRFDGRLTWGRGRSIAFLGGATSLAQRAYEADNNGGEAADEMLMNSPAWNGKVAGGTSVVPDAGTTRTPSRVSDDARLALHSRAGRHEWHVAWLAVQDSGLVHRPCKRGLRDRGLCSGRGDAHEGLRAAFSRTLAPRSEHALLKDMCAGQNRSEAGQYARRPAFLAFGASAYFVKIYGGAAGEKRRASKNDHYVDVGAFGANVTGRGVPRAFVEQLHRGLTWLLDNHRRLRISVALVSVLTLQFFASDPVRHAGIALACNRL